MNRNAIVVSVLFAGFIALGGTAAYAATGQGSHPNTAAANAGKASAKVQQKNSKPARAPALKPAPKYWPPGPTGHDAPPST